VVKGSDSSALDVYGSNEKVSLVDFVKSLNKIVVEGNLKLSKNKTIAKKEKEIIKAMSERFFNMDRHCKLNLISFDQHGTVEFRHHHGTVDPTAIKNWVMFCIQFFEYTMKKTKKPVQKDLLYAGVSASVKKYFMAVSKKNKEAAKKKTVAKKKKTVVGVQRAV
jgi:hypothetical protein